MNREFDINISEDYRRDYGLEIDSQEDIIYPNLTHSSIWLCITEGLKIVNIKVFKWIKI